MLAKIILIVAAVVIIGGAGYAVSRPDKPAEDSGDQIPTQYTVAEDPSMAPTATAEVAFSGSVGDLVTRGGQYICTFSIDVGTSQSSGTFYIAGSMVRGDFRSSVPSLNQTVESYMLQKDSDVYVWNSMTTQGFKTRVVAGTPNTVPGGFNFDQQYQYKCQAWSGDESKFALPAGVTFMESPAAAPQPY